MTTIGPETLRRTVASRAEQILEWTQALIRYPSENRPPGGSEGPLQGFLAAECRRQGWEVDEFSPEDVPGIRAHPLWLAGRDYGPERRNVVAVWKGTGGGRSVLLSGHADVAPFEPDDWKECRPFEPVLREGRLYGRGAADMKGGLAAAFWAMRILRELGFEPAGDLIFESVVDEEFASGNGTLASRLRGYRADLAITPEPTRMHLCAACLGAFLGRLTLTGKAGMAYMGKAIPNVVTGAARAIALFGEWQERWRARNAHPLFTEPGAELNTLLWKLTTEKPGEFTQMGTPLQAVISWIVWCYPGMTEETFYREFHAFWRDQAASDPTLADFQLALEKEFHFVTPWETDAHHPRVQDLVAAFAAATGAPPPIAGAAFSCDLGVMGAAGGMPAVMIGPRGGNLHAPDEWVETADILTLTEVFARLMAAAER
jgi:acetylornithine deacetylase